MGALANTLPLALPEGVTQNIASFAGRSCSVTADCGIGSDIANMEDVTPEMIYILSHGDYHPVAIELQSALDMLKVYS